MVSKDNTFCLLKAKDGEFFFSNWLRNRNTIEFHWNMGAVDESEF